MYNLTVNILIKSVLFVLMTYGLHGVGEAAQLSVKYERPESDKYLKIYQVLKANHKSMFGESSKYLEGLYDWQVDIELVVTSCHYANSRYLPDTKKIFICYESLYQKIYDYPKKANSKHAFERRVMQNVMFTFWHEVGHALIDQFRIGSGLNLEKLELLADEFAALSMLWRRDNQWKDILMISALHFKSKSERNTDVPYKNHPSDELRYQKMIALLYGFAQKSYARLRPETDQFEWLEISAHEYYLERSRFWEQNLRDHARKGFFDN